MLEGNGFVVAAYVVTWIGVIGYAMRLHRVSRDAKHRLAQASRVDAGRRT
jgi:CcmD family protein